MKVIALAFATLLLISASTDEQLPSCSLVKHTDGKLLECNAGTEINAVIQQAKENGNAFASAFLNGVYHGVYSGSATSVNFCCEVQKPLHYDEENNVWLISLAGTEVSKLEFRQYLQINERFEDFGFWVGPNAVPLPKEHDSGVRTYVVKNENWARTISLFIPATIKNDEINIVYLADGSGLSGFAARTADAEFTNTIFVGLHSAPREKASKVNYSRSREYLFRAKKNNDGFLEHNQFFITQIMPYVEKELLTKYHISKRYLMGQSSGAAWAMFTSIKYPELFHGAYVNSPVYKPLIKYIESNPPAENQEFYLMFGSIEPHASKRVPKIFCVLAKHKIKTNSITIPGGHSFSVWTKAFLGVAQPRVGERYATKFVPVC